MNALVSPALIAVHAYGGSCKAGDQLISVRGANVGEPQDGMHLRQTLKAGNGSPLKPDTRIIKP